MGNVGALHTIKCNTIWPNACYKTVNKQKIILLSGIKKGFHRGTKSYSFNLPQVLQQLQNICSNYISLFLKIFGTAIFDVLIKNKAI